MRAIYYDRTGDAGDVLQEGDLPTPEPGPGEVRVRVVASGVNPSDTKSRGGWGGGERSGARVIPHNDGAGEVDAVGEGVDRGRVGQRVWVYEATREGRDRGTCAPWCVVPERLAVPLPGGVGFGVGAALGVPAMTAHRALFANGSVRGRTVLVTGGGGGVGQMAVQLAAWGGARVLATVHGEEQAADALAHGADATADYTQGGVAAWVKEQTDGGGVDRIVDVNFGANLPVTLEVLKPYGTVATYASGQDPDTEVPVPFYRLLMKGLQVQTVFVYLMSREAHEHARRDVTAALGAGALTARIGATYPFSAQGVARAHDDLDARRFHGKAVVEVAEA